MRSVRAIGNDSRGANGCSRRVGGSTAVQDVHGGEGTWPFAITHAMRKELRTQRLADLATKQYGVVATRQLLNIGYTERAIAHATSVGRLHRIHHGVYAVGHTQLTAHGHQLAAVLACGKTALLSHGSAAWLWDLSPTRPSTPHVTVPLRPTAGARSTSISRRASRARTEPCARASLSRASPEPSSTSPPSSPASGSRA